MSSIGRGLFTLFMPPVCIGCGVGIEPICIKCAVNLRPSPRIVRDRPFPIASSLTYGKSSASVVLAAKEDGNKLACQVLASAIASSVSIIIEEISLREQVTLTWIPSTRPSRSRRGRDFPALLAKMVLTESERLRGLSRLHADKLMLRPLFGWNRSVNDQSKLRANERTSNLQGALYADKAIGCRDPVIIIDDVITTGSTLNEAFRALRERNLTPVGAATACATERRMLIR